MQSVPVLEPRSLASPLATSAEAAEFLKVTHRPLAKHAATCKVASVKVGDLIRFPVEELIRAAEQSVA